MARSMSIIVSIACLVFLGGCMAVRAPALCAIAIRNSPLPPGGQIESIHVQPILQVFPLDRIVVLEPPRATIRLRSPGSAEDLVAFYRTELAKRGWHEDPLTREPAAKLEGRYVFHKGANDHDLSPNVCPNETLEVEVRAAGDGTMQTEFTLRASYPMDFPGRALAAMNFTLAYGLADLLTGEVAIVLAVPAAVVITAIF